MCVHVFLTLSDPQLVPGLADPRLQASCLLQFTLSTGPPDPETLTGILRFHEAILLAVCSHPGACCRPWHRAQGPALPSAWWVLWSWLWCCCLCQLGPGRRLTDRTHRGSWGWVWVPLTPAHAGCERVRVQPESAGRTLKCQLFVGRCGRQQGYAGQGHSQADLLRRARITNAKKRPMRAAHMAQRLLGPAME